MDISVNRLLDKIGEELMEARKISSEAKVRERAYAIKAICELILEESSVKRSTEALNVVSSPAFVQPIQVPQQGRAKKEDGANGDSIFDF